MSAAAPAELVVDPSGLVPLGRNHMQTADLPDVGEHPEPVHQAAAGRVQRLDELVFRHGAGLAVGQVREVKSPLA